MKTYDDATAALKRYGHSAQEVVDEVNRQMAAAAGAQLRQQAAVLLAGLNSGPYMRSLAEELAKREAENGGPLDQKTRQQVTAVWNLQNAMAYQSIREDMQQQVDLGLAYGDGLKENEFLLSAIAKTHKQISQAQLDGLRSLYEQNKTYADQRKILDGIHGSLDSFFNKAIGGKLDFKSLALGILNPVRSKMSGDMADWVMSGLFPQPKVMATGGGVLVPQGAHSAGGLLGSLFGAGGGTPGLTPNNPLYVQIAGVGSVPGSLGNLGAAASSNGGALGSGGLLGMFGKGGLFGSGGFFSNLFNGGGGAGTTSSWLLSAFSGFFADGGLIPAGQWGIAGENGPEPVFGGSTGVSVVPYSTPSAISNPVSNDNRMSHSVTVNIDARGATPGMEQKISQIIDAKLVPAMQHTYRRSVTDAVQAVSARTFATGKGTL